MHGASLNRVAHAREVEPPNLHRRHNDGCRGRTALARRHAGRTSRSGERRCPIDFCGLSPPARVSARRALHSVGRLGRLQDPVSSTITPE